MGVKKSSDLAPMESESGEQNDTGMDYETNMEKPEAAAEEYVMTDESFDDAGSIRMNPLHRQKKRQTPQCKICLVWIRQAGQTEIMPRQRRREAFRKQRRTQWKLSGRFFTKLLLLLKKCRKWVTHMLYLPFRG